MAIQLVKYDKVYLYT